MDKSTSELNERSKSSSSSLNGSMRRPCSSGVPVVGSAGRPLGLLENSISHGTFLRVVVNRDEKGYGMKVSGDKPVYVQSVKEGGAAEKAGLHAGDKIIQVNGQDVMESTHTDVVGLIRSSTQVVLTVQQRPTRVMGSPSLHARPMPTQSSTRITGPKPVDHEKRKQFHLERVQTIRLMLEEEQRFVDTLRSELARSNGDEEKILKLTNAERNVATLQSQLQAILSGQNELSQPYNFSHHMSIPDLVSTRLSPSKSTPPKEAHRNSASAMSLPNKQKSRTHTKIPHSTSFPPSIEESETPPPLPKRNKNKKTNNAKESKLDPKYVFKDESENVTNRNSKIPKNINLNLSMCLDNEINSNTRHHTPINKNQELDNSPKKNNSRHGSQHLFGSKSNLADLQNLFNMNQRAMSKSCSEGSNCPPHTTNLKKSNSNPTKGVMVDNVLYNTQPPPLPPRQNPLSPPGSSDPDAVNSINKQMSYPLVATCATLVNNYPSHISNHTHHRTKSSPDPLTIMSPGESSRRLIASESLNDLSRTNENWESAATPPGTPPPPYPSPVAHKKHSSSNRNSANTDDGDSHDESGSRISPDVSPMCCPRPPIMALATSSPIQAATANSTQQPIISMEDDEISDQEVGQMEDHGPFKSLSRLWECVTHLAVFMNYVLSNSDPSSLLFYLLTDLYKEGNAKDMRKWAYEIHSSFLVPGAPLRLNNVDENIAREIDEVLLKEWDKEEILRKIFWKARNRAKEELNEQLADFQQKRTAGLGTIFGPPDAKLEEISRDKAKEIKLYETLLLNKLDPYLNEFEKETADPRRYITAAALATVITKVFGVRGTHTTHTALERCPTFVSKDKSFRTKFIGRYSRKLNVNGHHYVAQHYYTVISCNNCHQIIYGIGPQGYQCSVCLINLHRQCVKLYDDTCPGPIPKKDRGIGKFMDRIRADSKEFRRKPMDREKRSQEDKDGLAELEQFACDRPSQPVSRSSSDKRPDAVTEEVSKSTDLPDLEADSDISHDNVHNVQRARSSQPAINRSESYKEQSQKRRQIRERRKISDPNLSKSNDLDSDHPELSHSGSSSNSSLSSRSTESPQSTSLDAVPGSQSHGSTTLDSDMEIEPDPPDWQSSVSEEVLSRLHPEEKKRQEIINELFHTERSHVRNLRVLETVFYRPLLNNKHLPPEQIELMFSNLEEMLVIHGAFNAKMKKRRKEETVVGDIGELLLSMFDGPEGEDFQRAAATFCARQQLALESLKELRRKDNRLHQFLKDCESDRLCKRFQLKDIIPTGMQRLVKYPLLFESLVKCTERLHESTMRESIPTSSGGSMTPSGPAEELNRLRRAVERSKEILNYVNRAVKEAEDKARLQELQRRIDKTAFEKMEHPVAAEFKNVDLTQHKLIYEGPLTWRINKQKLNLHVVLTEEIIIFLQKQDEKYILKWYNSITGNERSLSPIVKVCTALVRPNATSKDSLFLVNTSHNGAQIYDLIAPSPNEYKIWFKHISDAAEAYKCREGKSRRSELSTPESEGADTSSTDVPAGGDADKSDLLTSGDIASGSGDTQSGSGGDTDSNVTSGENSQRNSGVLDDEAAEKRLTQGEGDTTASAGQEGSGSMGTSKREAQMRLATEDQPLIQPSEVLVNVLPVHIAQPVVTPIEQVRRKDEAIRRALAEKEALVAEILEVPPEEYHMIVDMAGDNLTGEKEPTELVLAAVNQANQLWSVVSESLNISDADAVLATSNQNPLCTSILQKNSFNNIPSVPCHRIHDIATTLNLQLTALLKVVKEREDEREKMRKELHKLREQVDTLHGEQLKLASVDCVDSNAIDGNHDLIQNEDLTNIEENP